jgi:hypothetical protein
MNEACECKQAGWCERHKRTKGPTLFRLCQERADYREMWDQQVKSRGLGDTLTKVFKAVGIKPCGGCKERAALLNKLVPYKDA